MVKCEFVKQTGEHCQAVAMRGTNRCFSHNPAAAESKLAAVARGGRNRRRRVLAIVPAKPIRIRTIDDVPGLLFRTIDQLRNGVLDVELARTVGYLSGIAARVVETVQLAQRVAAVEQQVLGAARQLAAQEERMRMAGHCVPTPPGTDDVDPEADC